MSLTCGIIGLPNVGKSTIFNALTSSSVPAENYPFCTIEPHIGIVPLPDKRLEVLGDIYNPQKITPATVEFTDIAGLVKGASLVKVLAISSLLKYVKLMLLFMSFDVLKMKMLLMLKIVLILCAMLSSLKRSFCLLI